MYIFYKIYLQWIYWTLFLTTRCSKIFTSDLPEYQTLEDHVYINPC
jgi:hypothetical protein